jgi:hypothetical protein
LPQARLVFLDLGQEATQIGRVLRGHASVPVKYDWWLHLLFPFQRRGVPCLGRRKVLRINRHDLS